MRSVVATILAWVVTSSSVFADDYNDALDQFVRSVEGSSITSGAYWFEMYNALGEWEKTMLIFGYAAPGDHAACQRLRAAAKADQPGRLFRCNPVK
jgi:hypothetical protein